MSVEIQENPENKRIKEAEVEIMIDVEGILNYFRRSSRSNSRSDRSYSRDKKRVRKERKRSVSSKSKSSKSSSSSRSSS
jgi:hypothetical protein